jgi:hypothetical protein
MDKFVVPQFIDAEDKILGPFTTRQFLIMLVDAFIIFILKATLDFAAFIMFSLVVFALGGTLAFMKVNGVAFHYFLLNFVQTMSRPGLRLWNKEYNDVELRAILREPPPPPPPRRVRKDVMTSSRLTELSLVVNTGGVYNPDED